MKYYRLPVQDYQSAQWKWKTTVLTSLQAVLQLLRSYRMLPQDGIRVFIASSEAELSKMLSQQNDHLESGSVTATQFLSETLKQRLASVVPLTHYVPISVPAAWWANWFLSWNNGEGFS